ncbi:MAG: hypothetical protein AAF141_09095 [Pseudomonadota bacterium]
MTKLLAWCGDRARWFLIGGLLIGGLVRPVAETLLPFVGTAIALLLFLACLRTGPKAAAGTRRDLRRTMLAVATLQIAVPLGVLIIGAAAAIPHAILSPLVLLLAASSVTVVPHFLAIMGMNTSHALRLLLVGTLLVPATAWVVFSAAGKFGILAYGDPGAILTAVLRLLAVVILAAGLAFALRLSALKNLGPSATAWTEGWAAILLAVVVIGLMAPMGAALTERPGELISTIALAFAVNFTLQLSAWWSSRLFSQDRAERTAFAAVNGNRNFALFLTALPLSTMEPMLLFIACYQVPNYLTPFVFRRLYAPKPRGSVPS